MDMASCNRFCGAAMLGLSILGSLAGCTKSEPPRDVPSPPASEPAESSSPGAKPSPAASGSHASAAADDVKAARARLDALGSKAKYSPKDGAELKEIVVEDAAGLTPDDVAL